MSNDLGQDYQQCSVGPKCLQRLSADDKVTASKGGVKKGHQAVLKWDVIFINKAFYTVIFLEQVFEANLKPMK